jgi:hypothetical protein
MPGLLIALVAVVVWCVAPLPLAVAVGRAFRTGEVDPAFAELAEAPVGARVPGRRVDAY